LDDILLGKYPQYPREKLLRRMVVSGYAVEKCNHCDYSQKRPTDLKTPLILHTINGIANDYRLDNLEILCFNCYFILVGNLKSRDLKSNVYDRPEDGVQVVATEDLLTNEQSMGVLSTMDLLSDEEKADIIKNLNDI
jgi:hypothetical protein